MAQKSFELAPGFENHIFLSYNSADSDAKKFVKDTADAFGEVGLKAWNYEHDEVHGAGVRDSMIDAVSRSACFGYVVGPQGAGKLHGSDELDYILNSLAEAERQQHLFIVQLPGAEVEKLPVELIKLDKSRAILGAADLDNGLTDNGLAKILASCLIAQADEGLAWLASRRRELFNTGVQHARALLVGVSNYDDADLKTLHGPHDDTAELAAALATLEFDNAVSWETTILHDPSADTLNAAVADFFTGGQVQAKDVLLFYYSGHGINVDGRSYMLAADSQAAAPSLKSLKDDVIGPLIRQSRAMAKIVILDCCHATPIDLAKSPYRDVPPRSAVLGASRGPTPAARKEGLSPYTKILNELLRTRSGADYALAQLADDLKKRFPTSWAFPNRAAEVHLGRGRLGPSATPAAAQVVRRLTIGRGCFADDRVRLLRQLAVTLDSLLAMASSPGDIPTQILEESLALLAGEFRQVMQPADADQDYWHSPGRRGRPELLGVSFEDEAELERLADLPWEYAGFCPDQAVPGAAAGWLWDGTAHIGRLFAAQPTKSALSTFEQAGVLFAPRASDTWSTLPQRAEAEVRALGSNVHHGRLTNYAKFRAFAKEHELLVIQAPVGDPEGQPALLIEPNETMQASQILSAIKNTALRCLVIETIADRDTPQAATLMRRLATQTARESELTVVAVCHQYAYTQLIAKTIEDAAIERLPEGSDDAAATELDPPLRLTFTAAFLNRVLGSTAIEAAAHDARMDVLTEVGKSASTVVGVPVVIRPDESQSTPGSAAAAEPHPTPNVGTGAISGRPSGSQAASLRPGRPVGAWTAPQEPPTEERNDSEFLA